MELKTLKLIKGNNETENAYWARYEKKLNELDYTSVNVQAECITITYYPNK